MTGVLKSGTLTPLSHQDRPLVSLSSPSIHRSQCFFVKSSFYLLFNAIFSRTFPKWNKPVLFYYNKSNNEVSKQLILTLCAPVKERQTQQQEKDIRIPEKTSRIRLPNQHSEKHTLLLQRKNTLNSSQTWLLFLTKLKCNTEKKAEQIPRRKKR